MTREIKFRAWSPKDKIMVEPFGLFEELQDYEQLIPLQWTGLLDKQGNEIYEGDILSYKGYTVDNTPYFIRYEVMWGLWDNGESYEDHDYGCGVYLVERLNLLGTVERFPEDRGTVHNYNNVHSIDEMEVIGNIWESPELLEVK